MNALVTEFQGRLETIKAWRHHLHKHPELSLQKSRTAKYIADLVRSWWTSRNGSHRGDQGPRGVRRVLTFELRIGPIRRNRPETLMSHSG